jgi:hypothetical protein
MERLYRTSTTIVSVTSAASQCTTTMASFFVKLRRVSNNGTADEEDFMFPTNRRILGVVGAALALTATGAKPAGARPNQAAYVADCKISSVFAGARTCTYTFRFTQTIETFVVPPTIGPVEITAVGAPGAGDRGYRSRGARVTGSFSSLGGMPIYVAVGGEGWFDGYNGGGPGGGGGASDVRLRVPDLDHRLIVAAGGGRRRLGRRDRLRRPGRRRPPHAGQGR